MFVRSTRLAASVLSLPCTAALDTCCSFFMKFLAVIMDYLTSYASFYASIKFAAVFFFVATVAVLSLCAVLPEILDP